MMIDTDTMISIAEANQDFSKVARIVDEHGSAVILRNNHPRYLVINFDESQEITCATNEEIKNISDKILEKNMEAYKVLAK